VRRIQAAAARAEFVSGKVEAQDAEAVTGQKITEKIEVVLRAGVPVSDHEHRASLAARFVIQKDDVARAAQVELHTSALGRQRAAPPR
jgi:hypothetical protein